ncbi:MAG: hypothetical protein ACKOXR_05090 [Bacteroidota bacterium]
MGTTPDSSGRLVRGAERWFFYAVLLVVVVAAVLRFGWMMSIPLTNDETSALMRLRVSGLGELINGVVWNDGHPMLVQVFLWYWTKWFGTSVWVVKLPFLLCGFGSVVVMIHIGMRLGRPWAGLMVAAMLATLQFPLMYSEIARPYAPGLLLCLWSFYLWLRWVCLCGGDSPRVGVLAGPMGLLSLSGYLGASNHYFNVLFLGLLFLVGLGWLPRRYWLRYLWPWALMVALYGHQVGIFFHHLTVGSPGWLSVPTVETLGKHVLYSVGYSVWVWDLWLLVGLVILVLRMRGPREAGETDAALGFVPFDVRGFVTVLLLYLMPLLIAFFYSVYRAPVFQDSVLLFSFPFGLLLVFWWLDSVRFPYRMKVAILVVTLGLNVYTLAVDRRHFALFGNQSYDGAVRTFQRWGLGDGLVTAGGNGGKIGDSASMWVYGFEPFFMEFHADALGWNLKGLKSRGMDVRYLREETDDYGLFRDRLQLLRGDDFYYVNMVGMDPMLRVWIQEAFPSLVREAMGPGYHVMHFSKRGVGKGPLYRTEKVIDVGIMGNTAGMVRQQYFPVCGVALDSLGEARFSAEFVAEAEVVLPRSLVNVSDLRLAISIADAQGRSVRFLDRGLGDMDYRLGEVTGLSDSLCVVKLYLSGRLVDVPWGAWRNHGGVGSGYQMQAFIDNAGRYLIGVRRIVCTFWEGNGEVYGLVNPRIP